MTTTVKHKHSIHVHANQVDPTRTLTLRTAFAREMTKRFRELRGIVRKAIVQDDVLALREPSNAIMGLVSSPGDRAFNFPRSQDKIAAFMDWFNAQVDEGILETTTREQLGTSIENAWTNTYIRQGYERGVIRGRGELLKGGFNVPSLAESGGIAAAFNQPMHLDRAGVLFTRTFNDLKGITDAMSSQIARTLAQGISEGIGPNELARQLTKVIGGDIGITDTLGRFIPAERRAKILARTEIIRAHHEGTIQEYENWRVANVIVKAEFTTAGDDRVCPDCLDLEGHVFTLEAIRGLIPVHPMCRCIALPVEV